MDARSRRRSRAPIAAALLAAAAAGVGLAPAARAAVVFFEDFEDPGAIEAHGWYDFAPPLPIVTDEAYDGARSLAQTLEIGALSQYGMRLPLPDLEVVYLRFARKFPADWVWPTVDFGPNDFLLFADAERLQTPTDSYLTLHVEEVAQGRASMILRDDLQGGHFGALGTELRGAAPVFTPGRWHVVDAMLRLNTPGLADGEVRMWVDGVLQVERTGLELRTAGFTHIDVDQLLFGFTYHEGSPVRQTFWTDHIVVADSPIGPDAGPGALDGGGPPSPDAAAPWTDGAAPVVPGGPGGPPLETDGCACRLPGGRPAPPSPAGALAPLVLAALVAASARRSRRRSRP